MQRTDIIYGHKGIEKGKSYTLIREILSRNIKEKQPEEKQKTCKGKKKYIPPKDHPWRNKLYSKIGHF